MGDECPRSLPVAAAGLAAGTWDVTVFRPGSVPSALARSSPSDAGHTQAPVRSRTGPMSGSSRISDSPRLGTATGFMRPRFRPWWARCRRHPPPGPRPAPSYVPAPPAPDATPPAPPRSSTRRQAAIRSAIVTRTPCCCRRCSGAVVTGTPMPPVSRNRLTTSRVPGRFSDAFWNAETAPYSHFSHFSHRLTIRRFRDHRRRRRPPRSARPGN